MKNKRKILSVILIASILTSVAGCSKKFDESMLSIADKACSSIAGGNYGKASKYFDDKNKKLEEAMTFDSDDDYVNEAAELILSTFTYEVDEDSYESDFFGKSGSVDVVFSYVDYEEVLDSADIFKDFDAFEAALEDCDDKVETTITLEFEKQDGDAVIVNSDDFIELFGFKDIEIEIAGPLIDYVTGYYFTGSQYDDDYEEYTDTDSIQFIIELGDAGVDLEWEYYYVIDGPGDYPMESDLMIKPEGQSTISIIQSSIVQDECIEEGFFTIEVYDIEENYVCGCSCYVAQSEPEPEPEPEPVFTGTLDYYVTSTDSPVTLYGDHIIFTTPSGWFIEPADSDRVIGGSNADNPITQLSALVASGPHSLLTMIYLDTVYYSAFTSDPDGLLELMVSGASQSGDTVTYSTVEREICGQTVTCYEAHIEGSRDIYFCNFVLEVEDTAFFVTVGGTYEEVEEACAAFSLA